ncbi:hypothetical protein [Brasilonema bromeliae]|uniref:Uncharacterized protein n=1 Tax=Brasilonema bromeliae SPC951 TaxID=385972 RepID=A0ABX1PFL0_9CYAN|nr:hypothetical protein [Brasilonema bromeliae]NMG22280.1 hypothetical protein [Brasilonema bromeliae SPC951]
MKMPGRFKIVPAALTMSLVFTNAHLAEAQVVQITSRLQPDPLIVNGTSGGSLASNCGNIATKPNQVIRVTESLPYLRLTVESGGQPTLLIHSPGGRFCVLADKYSGGKPEISGYWQAGNYSLYVGELSRGQYNYTLSISQQKILTK